MTAFNPFTVVPHTRIDNAIIDNMHEIGVFGFAVYSAIKRHLNQATGACFPSYATIARITGIHRSTVIECVKKLTALKLLTPQQQFKDDGSPSSNQYHFAGPGESEGAKKTNEEVVQPDHPSRPERPEQSENNKKDLTNNTDRLFATEKQKTCQHETPEVVILAEDNLRVCLHCYALLNENLKLRVEEQLPAEIVAA